MKRPLVWCSALFISGTYSVINFSVPFILVVIACIIFTSYAYKRVSYLILIVVFFLGMLPIHIYNSNHIEPIQKHNESTVNLTFEIKDIHQTRSKGGFYKYIIDTKSLNSKPFCFSGELYTPQKYSENDIVNADTKIFALPDDPTMFWKINNGYDFSSYSNHGTVTGKATPGITDKIRLLRKEVINRLKEQSNPHVFGFLSAILTGDRENITGYRAETFRKTGLSHLMAVSGLHVSLLLGFLLLILDALRTKRIIINIICTAFLLFLIPFMGFSTSAIRAVIMNLVLLWSTTVKKDADSLSSLAFAAIVILVFRPYSLKDLSFVLSFSATAGLILLSPLIENCLFKLTKRRFPSLSAVLAVHIILLPLNLYYFGGAELVSIPANLVFVPVFPVILLILIASVATGNHIPLITGALNKATEVFLGAVETVSRLRLGNFEISISEPMIIWLIITVSLGFVFKSKMRAMFFTVSALILADIILKGIEIF